MTESLKVSGINSDEVAAWLAERAAFDGALHFELITGGRSNLTYTVSDSASRRWVLRRPPLGMVLATAHDVAREHRLIDALTDSPVPVPPVIGLSADDSVNGAPFYMMDFVDGLVIRDAAAARHLSLEARSNVSQNLVKVLARLHSLDPDDVGLGDLAKREDYVGRQLKRWMRQFEDSQVRELPLVREVHDRLVTTKPEQLRATIVHGDYRLDNCIISDDGDVLSVLDWELSTLGEPRADFGLLLVYWAEAHDAFAPLGDSPTTVGGFATRRQLATWYCEESGLAFDDLDVDYFMAFSYWRLACILEGVYARYLGGAMGDQGVDTESFGKNVELLAETAASILDGNSILG